MHAGAGHLASRKQSRHRRPSVEIRFHAAHDVVRGGAHRNGIAREIEAGSRACLRDGREAPPDEVGIQMRQRQVDGRSGAIRLADDRSRDEVARREIAGTLVPLHERLAGLVDQPRALAAQRFRQEKPRRSFDAHHRGMKLDELEIGDARACTRGDGNAVAGGDRRVRRLSKNLTAAACREQRPGRGDAAFAIAAGERRAAAAAAAHDQAGGERRIHHANAAIGADTRPEQTGDLAARRVACMQDAAYAVGRLTSERRRAVGVAIEFRTPLDQLAHVARPFANQHVNRFRQAQPVAGGDRVARVQLG